MIDCMMTDQPSHLFDGTLGVEPKTVSLGGNRFRLDVLRYRHMDELNRFLGRFHDKKHWQLTEGERTEAMLSVAGVVFIVWLLLHEHYDVTFKQVADWIEPLPLLAHRQGL